MTDLETTELCDEIYNLIKPITIVNEDGTEITEGRPKNPLLEKWDRIYPPMRHGQPCSPICGYQENGRPYMNYTCVTCHVDTCRHSDGWKIPPEDIEEWKEYKKADREYDRIHNPGLYKLKEESLKEFNKTYDDFLDILALAESPYEIWRKEMELKEG